MAMRGAVLGTQSNDRGRRQVVRVGEPAADKNGKQCAGQSAGRRKSAGSGRIGVACPEIQLGGGRAAPPPPPETENEKKPANLAARRGIGYDDPVRPPRPPSIRLPRSWINPLPARRCPTSRAYSTPAGCGRRTSSARTSSST